MKASDFIKRFDERREREQKEDTDETNDHSLQAQAKDRAEHPSSEMHAGTAFDWEDMEGYQRELERLDREGPGKRPKHPH